MNKIINESGIKILARVAKRAALYRQIQEEKANDKRLAFEQYIGEQLEAAGESKQILNDPQARSLLEKSLQDSFVYVQSAESISKINALQEEADSYLPPNIASERWATGDCQCVLERIYDKNDMENTVQTFNAKPCAAHQGLTTEELHDTIKKETKERGELHRFILENLVGTVSTKKQGINPETGKEYPLELREGIDLSFEFTGTGKNRSVQHKLKGIELNQIDSQKIISFRTQKQ